MLCTTYKIFASWWRWLIRYIEQIGTVLSLVFPFSTSSIPSILHLLGLAFFLLFNSPPLSDYESHAVTDQVTRFREEFSPDQPQSLESGPQINWHFNLSQKPVFIRVITPYVNNNGPELSSATPETVDHWPFPSERHTTRNDLETPVFSPSSSLQGRWDEGFELFRSVHAWTSTVMTFRAWPEGSILAIVVVCLLTLSRIRHRHASPRDWRRLQWWSLLA